jgi:hypothetical protein
VCSTLGHCYSSHGVVMYRGTRDVFHTCAVLLHIMWVDQGLGFCHKGRLKFCLAPEQRDWVLRGYKPSTYSVNPHCTMGECTQPTAGLHPALVHVPAAPVAPVLCPLLAQCVCRHLFTNCGGCCELATQASLWMLRADIPAQLWGASGVVSRVLETCTQHQLY